MIIESTQRPTILLTGATGYIGGRLLPALLSRGYRVRCLARNPARVRMPNEVTCEIVRGDVLDRDSLALALRGIKVAYYLVHSLGRNQGFEDEERRGAENFAAAAREAGVRRIVYLGGLGDTRDELSPHLRSRQEVGRLLRNSGVQVIEFRASIVIGSGSLSFEMIRALTERLPVMITPRWVSTLSQPIAIEDVVAYLATAADVDINISSGSDGYENGSAESRVFEIGGPDRVSYADLIREYARQRGLRRLMIPVPVLTPWLSALWLGLVTPLFARVGRKLIDGIRNPTIVRDDVAVGVFAVRPRGVADAIARALHNEDQQYAATHWFDALSSSGQRASWATARFGNRLVDSRVVHVEVSPAEAFAPIRRIGGQCGWYYADWLWTLRGVLDLMAGGVGIRRGRRDAEALVVGDVVDCWRVETYEPERRLSLAAEMKLPGRAWLQFEVVPEPGGSAIRQTAIFDPQGLSGLAYWYLIYPLHEMVFAGMLRGLATAAVGPKHPGGRVSSRTSGYRQSPTLSSRKSRGLASREHRP